MHIVCEYNLNAQGHQPSYQLIERYFLFLWLYELIGGRSIHETKLIKNISRLLNEFQVESDEKFNYVGCHFLVIFQQLNFCLKFSKQSNFDQKALICSANR